MYYANGICNYMNEIFNYTHKSMYYVNESMYCANVHDHFVEVSYQCRIPTTRFLIFIYSFNIL